MDYLSITVQRFKQYVDKSLFFQEFNYPGIDEAKESAKTIYGLLIDFGLTQLEIEVFVDEVRAERSSLRENSVK